MTESLTHPELQNEINLGKELMRTRQYERAEEILLKILKKHKLADIYNALGVVHADQGKFNFAETSFKKALEINPHYMEAALNLAVLYNNLGLGKKSKALYETLKKYGAKSRGAMDPILLSKISNLHADVGSLYHSVGEYKEAIKEYEKAVELCPHFVDVQTKLATAYREAGKKAKALKIFSKNKFRAKRYAPFWIALGVTHYSSNNKSEARKAWKAALKIDPNNSSALAYSRLI